MTERETTRIANRPTVKTFISKIYIKNFKSIKELTLELQPGVNVLVGRNASGKTNILEAVYFLYKALIEASTTAPYKPHSPLYWSARDLIYNKESDLPVELGVELELYMRNDETGGWNKVILDFKALFLYEHAEDTLKPQKYVFQVNKKTEIHIEPWGLRVIMPQELYRKASSMKPDILKDIGNEYKYEVEDNSIIVERSFREHARPSLIGILVRFPAVLSGKLESVGSNLIAEHIFMFHISEPLLILYPRYSDIVDTPRGINITFFSPSKHKFPGPIFMTISAVLNKILSGITFLRHPDIGTIGEPARFTGTTILDPRGKNLAEVLLSYQGMHGRLPPRVERLLNKAFPRYAIRIQSGFGRVTITGLEDGIELPPPNLPDGLIKLVFLMTALDLQPSILLVDELENSMHAELLEYVIDEFNNVNLPVLIATHSPVVIDLVDPSRIIVVKRDPLKGTLVEYIEDADLLSKILHEEGITLSDYVLYSKTI